MRRYRWSSLLVLLFTTLTARAALAESSLAILGIEPLEVPESLAQQLTDALRQRAAATAGIRIVQGKDLIEIKMIFNCDTENPNCMAQAGKSLGADKLLYGTLKRHGGRSSTSVVLGLKLLDVRSGIVEKFVNETIHKRDLARAQVGPLAGRWLGALVEVAKPTLTVTSDPPGSTVVLDGQTMGRTPVTLRDLPSGPHALTVSQPGYVTWSKNVELRPGSSHEIVASLDREKVVVAPPPVLKPPPPPVFVKPPPVAVVTPPPIVEPPPPITPPHPGRLMRIIGFTAVGAAVVMGGVAIYTWRKYSDLQDTAHSELLPIRDSVVAMPNRPTVPEAQFFNGPNCSPPPSLTGAAVTQYKNDCNSGTTFANVTTALWVVSGVLAAGGVAAIIVGERQAAKARHPERTAGMRLRESLQIAPVFTTQGGGLQAAFEF